WTLCVVAYMSLLNLTCLGSGATLLICLPTSLGGRFSKIRSSGFLWVTWHCHLDSDFGRDAQILASINSRIRIFLAPRRQERQVRKSILFLCGLCVFAGDNPNFGCASPR